MFTLSWQDISKIESMMRSWDAPHETFEERLSFVEGIIDMISNTEVNDITVRVSHPRAVTTGYPNGIEMSIPEILRSSAHWSYGFPSNHFEVIYNHNVALIASSLFETWKQNNM